jgi:hypothetical protein
LESEAGRETIFPQLEVSREITIFRFLFFCGLSRWGIKQYFIFVGVSRQRNKQYFILRIE